MTPAHIPRLTTKLTPPAVTPYQVARHPAGLDAPTAARVVLVRAPAGFGKSTAMMQCHRAMEARGQSAAWLTLDALDNDLSRFLHYLGEMMVQAGIASAPPLGPVEAVDAIAAHPSAFTFFMDDLDALRDAGVLGLLRELIERLPRGGLLVLGCRSWPDLGLGRLRARGQLVEVGPAQLRFSLEETREFLRNRCAPAQEPLPEHALLTLHNRCEGWATGLWLASLALQRRRDTVALAESFSGSDQALAEYLAEDVLAHELPEVREFLLRTSVLKQLTAPVCAALCPQTDCAAMLEHLATHGVFLTRIGDAPPTWRYHSLFASFLHARLQQQPLAPMRELHVAASHAYEAEGRPVPAIDHAILAQDHARAIALLAAHAESFVSQGRLRLLDRWFQAISAAALQGHERLTHLSLWAACFTRGPIETLAQMGCGDARPAEGEAAQYLALRAMLLALQDRYADAYAVGRRALAVLPSELPFADSALLNLMANISSVLGRTDESRRLLGEARSRFGSSPFNRMYAESLEGMLDLFEGRMRQATARFRIAVESTHQATFSQSHGNAWAGVLYAYGMYEANRLEKADHLLNIYLPMARDVGLPDHMILGHALRTRLAFAAGDVDSALHTLTELEHLGHLRHLPRVVAAAHLERARIFMQQGNSRAAQDELRRASAIPPCDGGAQDGYRLLAQDLEYPALAQLRWNACFGDALATSGEAMAQAIAAERAGRYRRALKLRLIHALAEHRAGRPAAALLEPLLQTACREGFVRLVLDEAPWITPLLAAYLAATQGSGGDADPIYAEYLRQLQASAHIALDADPAQDTPAPPAEPLTRKEVHVLQLLADGYSNSAIAEKMVVADTTVRTHLRHINAKLGAGSRTQAVALARRLRLIP
ncbi:LuxR C-terminal-related transcriptional regulator [Alicycliphilus denitrificans]|uniref:LuxR C-terminal-related transcriptional regulator n=1 Tax=Alicycliphilus denitrificans TaxID=179636 RepID=UPI00217D34AC|nr:LuxR C-terminal-related transcriptional regulator [Alicycliphilus denitrificans]